MVHTLSLSGSLYVWHTNECASVDSYLCMKDVVISLYKKVLVDLYNCYGYHSLRFDSFMYTNERSTWEKKINQKLAWKIEKEMGFWFPCNCSVKNNQYASR